MLKNKAEKDELNRKVQDMNEQIDEKEEEGEELQKVYENAESNYNAMIEQNKSILDPIKNEIGSLNQKLEPIALKQDTLKNILEGDEKDIAAKEHKLQDEKANFNQYQDTYDKCMHEISNTDGDLENLTHQRDAYNQE